MRLLITGGAGYIGSHMLRYANELGHEVVVLDDFSTGHEWALKDCEILRVNLLDYNKLSQELKSRHFDGVIHFAAKSLVHESFIKPDVYYRNNIVGTLNLVNVMLENDINNLVFSSTAAIFGTPLTDKITEDHQKKPINPYGNSKLITENILKDICRAYDFNTSCLRYFNAAGAHESGEIGEAHDPETHLIPNILNAALLKDSSLKVYGNDYPTPDGTCIRDYIHVTDLAQAHLLALDYISNNKGYSAFNLGNGDGFSILEVIKCCQSVTNLNIDFEIHDRREGDPAILVADTQNAEKVLGWDRKFDSLEQIITSSALWHEKFLD
jgi:UDP-glucose 4-epimerase